MRERNRLDWAFICLVAAFQLLPILAVALNAFATDWAGTVLPEGYTLDHVRSITSDPRFLQSIYNSLLVSVGSLILTPLIVVPAVLIAHCYFPILDRWMAILVILPFAVPGIVLALGLLRIYSGNYGIVLTGTPWVLIFGYMPVAAPLYYVPIKNNLRTLRLTELFEAGRLLGASDFAIFTKIVVPCIKQGLIIGLVMNFTLAVSDFVYANLLVGGHFPTLQIFMGVLNGGSGRKLSVLITTYFVVIFASTAIVVWAASRRDDK
ncbi:MAG: ABC transporter permease subunit [Proteobacteria bacterium]|nr:ABC transporter permease subunit [Pseudomonadota bacterium]